MSRSPLALLPKIAEDPLAEIRDDIDDQVLPIFIEKRRSSIRASEQVTGWRRSPHDGNFSDGLKRTLHTLKGSARAWRAPCASASSRTTLRRVWLTYRDADDRRLRQLRRIP